MSDWQRRLRYGIGALTASESGGLITWRDPLGPTPAYAPGEVGIYGPILPESPDEAISLSTYGVQESPDTIVGAQFRIRALTAGRLDLLEDAVTSCWADRWGGNLNNVRLVAASWQSGADLGQDQNGRQVRSVNLYLRVERPLPHRTT